MMPTISDAAYEGLWFAFVFGVTILFEQHDRHHLDVANLFFAFIHFNTQHFVKSRTICIQEFFRTRALRLDF